MAGRAVGRPRVEESPCRRAEARKIAEAVGSGAVGIKQAALAHGMPLRTAYRRWRLGERLIADDRREAPG